MADSIRGGKIHLNLCFWFYTDSGQRILKYVVLSDWSFRISHKVLTHYSGRQTAPRYLLILALPHFLSSYLGPKFHLWNFLVWLADPFTGYTWKVKIGGRVDLLKCILVVPKSASNQTRASCPIVPAYNFTSMLYSIGSTLPPDLSLCKMA